MEYKDKFNLLQGPYGRLVHYSHSNNHTAIKNNTLILYEIFPTYISEDGHCGPRHVEWK
jgi:hypothetical protein